MSFKSDIRKISKTCGCLDIYSQSFNIKNDLV